MPPAARVGDMHTCHNAGPNTCGAKTPRWWTDSASRLLYSHGERYNYFSEKALHCVRGALELDPNFEPAKALRIQIEAAIGSGKQAGSL